MQFSELNFTEGFELYIFWTINLFKQKQPYFPMGFFDLFSGRKRELHRIYCQGCYREITEGYISKGEARCGRRKEDGTRCLSNGLPTFADTEGFQEAIRNGTLVKYSLLEQKADSLKSLKSLHSH